MMEYPFENDNVVSLIPYEDDFDLENHPSVFLAQDECDQLAGENHVTVVDDEELQH